MSNLQMHYTFQGFAVAHTVAVTMAAHCLQVQEKLECFHLQSHNIFNILTHAPRKMDKTGMYEVTFYEVNAVIKTQ